MCGRGGRGPAFTRHSMALAWLFRSQYTPHRPPSRIPPFTTPTATHALFPCRQRRSHGHIQEGCLTSLLTKPLTWWPWWPWPSTTPHTKSAAPSPAAAEDRAFSYRKNPSWLVLGWPARAPPVLQTPYLRSRAPKHQQNHMGGCAGAWEGFGRGCGRLQARAKRWA